MTKDRLLQEAASLEAQAKQNDVYAAAMEKTNERTGGRLGSTNAPNSYVTHLKAAADKRDRAAKLRVAAQALGRLGGKANTPAQNAARAKNAKKGGWPKGRPRKTPSTTPQENRHD